jgi:hypothetical protein
VSDLEKLESELEDDNTPDTKISPEKQAAIYKFLRDQLLERFHTLKTSAKINRKVGDHQMAEAQFNDAKRVLQMISTLDEETKGA